MAFGSSTGFRIAAAASLLASASADALWPKPSTATLHGNCLSLSPTSFYFSSVGASSAILSDAFARYTPIAFVNVTSVMPANCTTASSALPMLLVNVTSSSLDLSLNTSEVYVLDTQAGTLVADTVYGAIRGLESFSQLVDYRPDLGTWVVAAATIADQPVFKHRGALVDTARHFLPLTSLYQFLDAMAYNKMNVFHWHVVDDQSFPWVSTSLPALNAQGAWGAPNPAMVSRHSYSPADVQAVITYAQFRGIRVVPEFDTPGHSLCWENGEPGLLTQCYNTTTNQPIPGSYGPIDPTQAGTWTFMQKLFAEVTTVFPDAYVHVGGDEVSYSCWASNPNINAWMASNGIAPGDYASLEGYYVQKVLDLMHSLGKSYMGWQEIFDNGLRLEDDTVVGVWKYHNTGAEQQAEQQLAGLTGRRVGHPLGPKQPNAANVASAVGATPTWQEELFNVTQAGYRAVVSSPWYLNYISYGMDWPQYYTADLLDFNGTVQQQALVMGGEMAMWGEYVDGANVIARSWPRASAVAEALWSNPGANGNITEAEGRLLAHRCRMLNRGLSAEPPNGPAYCPVEWQMPYSPPWATQ